MAKQQEEEKYEGDYKVGISDKGRISFNLNWKWAVGIAITILGFVGYLLLDKYHFTPMDNLKTELAEEVEKRENNGKILTVVVENQTILLERSGRTITFIDDYNTDHSHGSSADVVEIEATGGPGASDVPE